MGREGKPVDLRDQDSEAVLLHEVVQPGEIGDCEWRGDIHGICIALEYRLESALISFTVRGQWR